jgi:hypothetical protein
MAGTDTSRGISPKELADQLLNTGTSMSGIATGGTNNTLIDTTRNNEVNLLIDAIIKITHAGITYYRTITGNTADTVSFNALPVGISVVAGDAYQVPSNPKASGGGGIDTGLGYRGVVTAIPAANQFTIDDLIDQGAGIFDGAVNPYYAFVMRDAAGGSAAPQGEIQVINNYVSATGVFTTTPFSVPVAVDDVVLILHPSIAWIIGGGGGPVPKLYVGNVVIAVNTIDNNDVVITGNLTVNAGITYTVNGKLQVGGVIDNSGDVECIALSCGDHINQHTGSLYVYGKVDVYDNITVSGPSGVIYISGEVHCGTINVNETDSSFTINSGNLYANNISASVGGASIYIYSGDVHAQTISTNGNGSVIYINGGNVYTGNPGGIIVRGIGADIQIYGGDVHSDILVDDTNANFSIQQGNVYARNISILDATSICKINGHAQVAGDGLLGRGDVINNGILFCNSMDVGGKVDNTGATSVNINGDCKIAGALVNDICTTSILGKTQVGGNITNVGTLSCLSMHCGGDINNTGAVKLNVKGDMFIKGILTNTIGLIEIEGKIHCNSLEQTDATRTGVIFIGDDCFCVDRFNINGAGNSDVCGKLHSSYIYIALVNFTCTNNVNVDQDIVIYNTAVVRFLSLECGKDMDNTGATSVNINGDCKIAGALVNGASNTFISGILLVCGTIYNTGGHFGYYGVGNQRMSGYKQETTGAITVTGVTWKDLLDKSYYTASQIIKPTEIWGIKVTKGGVWAGLVQLRIVDNAGTKLFPFSAQAVEGTDFADATVWMFPSPIYIEVATGYKIQFRSTNAADGAGETLTLNELNIIERSTIV